MTTIPVVDLKAQFETIRDEVLAAVRDVLDSQRFILGPRVGELEARVAELSGTSHAVGCASGSDALILALAACGVGPGAEVVTSPFTFFASAGSIAHTGARAVFCDIDASFNLDPQRLESCLGPNVRAVMPVHLFGLCAEMDPILRLAASRGCAVVEDAAQAIGAGYRGPDGRGPERIAGSMGSAAGLSFFPTKNLGGAGDGGMVTTSDEGIAARLRLLRVHGGRKMYHHEVVGWNSRLDELQAAILLVKIGRLADWSLARARRADRYDALLTESGCVARGLVTLPPRRTGSRHIFHQYTIRTARRDGLREHLESRGVSTGVYYPVPLHLQECFRPLGYARGDFPESEKACAEVLSLPIYPELADDAQRSIVREIAAFHGVAARG